jgi:hypothetical protein
MTRALLLALALTLPAVAQTPLRIEVTIPSATPLNGHLIIVIAKLPKSGEEPEEPRNQLDETYTSAQGFGVDTDNLAPNTPLVIDANTVGYPLPNLSALPAGDYLVQAVFNKYEPFHMASGKTLMLPPDQGEGQHWNRKPGNPYNEPIQIHIDPASSTPIKLTLDKIIPPITGTPDDPEVIAKRDSAAAKYLKYLKFRSPKLSAFYGRDMYLGAWILLPEGFDEHPNAHYPLIVYQDHYHPAIGPVAFTSHPPVEGANKKHPHDLRAERGYQFYQQWTNGSLPTSSCSTCRTPIRFTTTPTTSTPPTSAPTAPPSTKNSSPP